MLGRYRWFFPTVQFLVHSGINYDIVAHIFIYFGCYWVGWEDIHHSFQNMSLFCESIEYWLYNLIFEFWSLMQQQKQRVSDFLKTQFLLNFGILFSPWRRFFIPFRTMFQCLNVTIIGSAFSCWSFDVSHRRWWKCIIISAPNSGSILVFFFSPESDFLYLLIACFNVQMWPVLLLQFHFEFLMFPSARDGAVYHYFWSHFFVFLGVLTWVWKV